MDKYFSGNVFKFLIFFNLLTFNKRVLNLVGLSREKWITLARRCDWLFAADVTHSCVRAPLTQDQALSWQRRLMISFMVPQKPDWSGLVAKCQLKTYPITLNLLIYHHGTGPQVCLIRVEAKTPQGCHPPDSLTLQVWELKKKKKKIVLLQKTFIYKLELYGLQSCSRLKLLYTCFKWTKICFSKHPMRLSKESNSFRVARGYIDERT